VPNRNAFYNYHMTRSHIILWARERLSGHGILRSAGYHIAFLFTMIRYAVVSLVHFDLRFFLRVAELFRIHFGNIEKGSVRG
jgi:hypothetical protein